MYNLVYYAYIIFKNPLYLYLCLLCMYNIYIIDKNPVCKLTIRTLWNIAIYDLVKRAYENIGFNSTLEKNIIS